MIHGLWGLSWGEILSLVTLVGGGITLFSMAKTLQTDADIDDYVEKIRSQLKQLLKNCDEIKLN